MSFQRNAFQGNAFQTEGAGVVIPVGSLRGKSRRRRKPLYTVWFDDQQIGVDSGEELIHLATLHESIPRVTLSKKVDYGPILNELKQAIRILEVKRQEAEDDEVIVMLLH
jgi:hypothetical protein